MKVGELVDTLKGLNAELEVLCYTEDEEMLDAGHSTRVLDILGVSVVDAMRHRGENQVPGLEFGKGDNSEKFALIEITGDF